MLAVFVFLFLLVLGVVIGSICLVGFGLVAERGFHQTFERIAQANRGQVSRLNRQNGVTFQRSGIAFRVTMIRLRGKSYLQVTAPIDSGHFRMKVFEELINPKLKQFLGMQDIVVGWPEFDDRYIVQSNSEHRLRQFLTRPVQSALLKLGKKIEVQIAGQRFAAQVFVHRDDNQFVEAMTQRIVDAYFELPQIRETPTTEPAVIEMHLSKIEEALCMVCGEKIVSDRVNCQACKTPHHEECWIYLGMCSTYACGHKTYGQHLRNRLKQVFRINR